MNKLSIKFEPERVEEILIINLSGDVRGLDVQEFHKQLWKATGNPEKFIVLDLEGLAYINSAGLRSILMVAKRLHESGTKFAICSARGGVKGLFSMAAFDKVIDVFEFRSEAIEAIRS